MQPLDSLLSLIAPHHCFICRKEGSTCCQKCLSFKISQKLTPTCYKCSKKISLITSASTPGICKLCIATQSLNSVSWPLDFEESLAEHLIKSLKFNHLYQSAKPIAQGLQYLDLDLASISNPSNIIVTAIPTANERVRQRGWDQAKLIAKKYARLEHLNCKSLLLRASSFDQIGASKLERSEASVKFFKPRRLSLIKGSTVILIDDVVTTGSTLNAAAKILKDAGANEVHGLVFARQGLHKIKYSNNPKS